MEKHKLISKSDFWALILLLIPSALVGARIYHVLDFWEYYSLNLNETYKIWHGGLGIFGALILGLVIVFVYSRIKKQNFFIYSDLLLFFAPLIQVFGRIGNYFNKELFGKATSLPWGIYVPEESRPDQLVDHERFHPLFFYEAILDIFLFLVFVFLYKKERFKLGDKKITSFYLIGYGVIRLILEPLRLPEDSFLIGNLNLSYILSFVFILGGLVIGVRKLNLRNAIF